MALFSFPSRHNQISRRSARRAQVREFGSGASIQQLGDLLLQLEAYQSDSNNKYITRESQVDETLRKYRGLAVKGNILLPNILETRAAFTAGRGLSTNWEGEAEQQFIKQFFLVNKIKLAFIRQLARERAFEGQVLLVLQPHADKSPACGSSPGGTRAMKSSRQPMITRRLSASSVLASTKSDRSAARS